MRLAECNRLLEIDWAEAQFLAAFRAGLGNDERLWDRWSLAFLDRRRSAGDALKELRAEGPRGTSPYRADLRWAPEELSATGAARPSTP